MARRLLLTLTGFGIAAVGLLMSSGTAHALMRVPAGPQPSGAPISVPAPPPVPTLRPTPRPATNPSPAPRPASTPAVPRVVPAVTHVARVARPAAPVASPRAVVTKVVTTITQPVASLLPVSLPPTPAAPRASVIPGATLLAPTGDSGNADLQRATFAAAHAPTNLASAPTFARSSASGSPAALALDAPTGSATNAPAPTNTAPTNDPPTNTAPTNTMVGAPFALTTEPVVITTSGATRLTFTVDDRDRPGFLVGISRPG